MKSETDYEYALRILNFLQRMITYHTFKNTVNAGLTIKCYEMKDYNGFIKMKMYNLGEGYDIDNVYCISNLSDADHISRTYFCIINRNDITRILDPVCETFLNNNEYYIFIDKRILNPIGHPMECIKMITLVVMDIYRDLTRQGHSFMASIEQLLVTAVFINYVYLSNDPYCEDDDIIKGCKPLFNYIRDLNLNYDSVKLTELLNSFIERYRNGDNDLIDGICSALDKAKEE